MVKNSRILFGSMVFEFGQTLAITFFGVKYTVQ